LSLGLGSTRPTLAHACQLLSELAEADQSLDIPASDARTHLIRIQREAGDPGQMSIQELNLEIRLHLEILQTPLPNQEFVADPIKLIPAIAVGQRLGRWATGRNPQKLETEETTQQYIVRLLQYYVDGLDSAYLGETDASVYYYQNLRAFEWMNWAETSKDPSERWQRARAKRQHDLASIVNYLRHLKSADS